MREIKFRGGCHGEWFYGSLVISADKKTYTIYDHDTYRKIREVSVAPETVGQYTGLKDKNGVEIYEGDIVNCYDNDTGETTMHKVAYMAHQDYPAYDLYPSVDIESNALQYFQVNGTMEVIGNIHEHPEPIGDFGE